MALFDNLKKKATPSKGRKTAGKKVELPRTTAFVQALVSEKTRLSYAALADAAEQLGEHTATGLSAGQRGSRLVGSLPVNLQPHVCRGNGSYQKGTDWPEADVPTDLRTRGYVRPEAISQFVQAFVAAENASQEPDAEDLDVINDDADARIDDADARIDELDEAHDNFLEEQSGALDRD